MGRKRSVQLPAAKQFGQYARVWHPVARQWVHLGVWQSIEAESKWRRIAAEYVRNPSAGAMSADAVTVADVMTGYLESLKRNGASVNVRDQDGRACTSLAVAYGDLPIGEFGPVQIKTWASSLADTNLAAEFGWERPRLDDKPSKSLGRKTVKAFIAAVLRAIRWAIGNDLVRSAETRIEDLANTDVMAGIKAKPPKKRHPADSMDVERTLQELTPTLQTAVLILRLTGMRTMEMLTMRPIDIRRGGVFQLANGQRIRIKEESEAARKRGEIGPDDVVWWYVPESHKTAHHGISRVIPIMPVVQKLLAMLPGRDSDAPYISPKESTAEFRDRQRINRISTGRKPQFMREKKKRPKKAPTDQYQASQFRQAILRACKRAGVDPWTPHQLRHAASTAAVDATGDIRAVQQLLGHDSPRTTEGYTATTMAGAVRAAAALVFRKRAE
jgi:integrase